MVRADSLTGAHLYTKSRSKSSIFGFILTSTFDRSFVSLWRDAGVFDLVDARDSPLVSPAEIERIYMAANFDGKATTPYLERHELNVAVIRLAVVCYYDSEIVDTAEDAVAKLLEDVVYPAARVGGGWRDVVEPDDFRRKKLYTKTSCDAFRPHLRDLRRVFKAWCFEGRYVDYEHFVYMHAYSYETGRGAALLEDGFVREPASLRRRRAAARAPPRA